MTIHAARRRVLSWVLLLIGVFASVGLCIGYVDRPVARFAHSHWADTSVFIVASAVLSSSRWVLGVLAPFALGSCVWPFRRRSRPGWVETMRRATFAACVALGIAFVFKLAVGRSEADPLYLVRHLYEFRPFQSTREYTAFPSATMAVASALLISMGRGRKRRIPIISAVLVLVALFLVVTNSHWVGDILGGLYVGAIAAHVLEGDENDSAVEEERM